MKGRLSSLVNPRTVLFVLALLNLLWFLTQSRIIQEFGSSKITFCVVCPWYWDLTIGSPPVLSWIAAAFLLLRRVSGTFMAGVVSGYEVVEGYSWLTAGGGFPASVLERIEILRRYGSIAWWELLDLQYLFAFVIFTAAAIYLVVGFIRPSVSHTSTT